MPSQSVSQLLLEASQQMTGANSKLATILSSFDQIIAENQRRITELEQKLSGNSKKPDITKPEQRF